MSELPLLSPDDLRTCLAGVVDAAFELEAMQAKGIVSAEIAGEVLECLGGNAALLFAITAPEGNA